MKILVILIGYFSINFLYSQDLKEYKSLKKIGEFHSTVYGISQCSKIEFVRKMTKYELSEQSRLWVPNEKKENEFAEKTQVWKGQEIYIYPNPTAHYLNIDFINFDGKPAQLIVRDNTGRLIQKAQISTKKSLSWDVSMLPKGIYNISIYQTSQKQDTKLFVKE